MGILIKILLILFLFPSLSWGSGTGAVNDPYTTTAELNTGITSASCGDTIYLKTGTYNNTTTVAMNKVCTTGNQLRISVSDGTVEDLGGVEFTGTSRVIIRGSYQTLRGFYFNATSTMPVEIGGDDGGAVGNIVEECKMLNVGTTNGGICIGLTTSDNTYNIIRNNHFKDTGTWAGYMIRVRHSTSGTTNLNNIHNQILNNVFEGHSSGSNYETIQIGDGESPIPYYFTMIANNYFLTCGSDNELVSLKTGKNYVVGNTIVNGEGQIRTRMGDYNSIIANIFYYDVDVATAWFRGIGINGGNNLISNNYIYGGGYTAGITAFSGNTDSTIQVAANNSVIEHNTVHEINGFAYNFYSDGGMTVAPSNLTYLNNIGEDTTGYVNYCFGYGYIGSGHIWSGNRGYVSSGVLAHASITSGVTNAGAAVLTNQKAGLTVNWWYPSAYVDGASGQVNIRDIQGQAKASSGDVGCDESGGTDSTIAVGLSWEGTYTINSAGTYIIRLSDTGYFTGLGFGLGGSIY